MLQLLCRIHEQTLAIGIHNISLKGIWAENLILGISMARGHVNRVCFPCTCMHCDFSCQVYKVIKFDKKPLNSGDNVVPKTNCFGLDSFGQKKGICYFAVANKQNRQEFGNWNWWWPKGTKKNGFAATADYPLFLISICPLPMSLMKQSVFWP